MKLNFKQLGFATGVVSVVTALQITGTVGPALAQDVGAARAPLVGGQTDQDTPRTNATVRVFSSGVSCTGTLIAEDIVVSAGHCFGQRQTIEPEDSAALDCADREIPAQWYRVTGRTTIAVGRDATRYRFATTVKDYALPGCRDVVAFRLTSSVPPQHATPVKVLTRFGAGLGATPAKGLRNATLSHAGWGLNGEDRPVQMRQAVRASYFSNDRIFARTRGNAGARANFGDSGGPLYLDHWSGQRFLVGVVQGFDGNGLTRSTPTFSNAYGSGADIGWFFEQISPDSTTCDAFEERPANMVPLVSWWNGRTQDNHATTDPEWSGCRASRISPDYGFNRIEGYIFDPNLPQPEGTVRLTKWFSPKRGDYSTMSLPNWTFYEGKRPYMSPDYRAPQIEGYVYDPDKAQPSGTIRLYRHWSPSRGDNWTTTQYQLAGALGRGIGPDYGRGVLVGFIRPASN